MYEYKDENEVKTIITQQLGIDIKEGEYAEPVLALKFMEEILSKTFEEAINDINNFAQYIYENNLYTDLSALANQSFIDIIVQTILEHEKETAENIVQAFNIFIKHDNNFSNALLDTNFPEIIISNFFGQTVAYFCLLLCVSSDENTKQVVDMIEMSTLIDYFNDTNDRNAAWLLMYESIHTVDENTIVESFEKLNPPSSPTEKQFAYTLTSMIRRNPDIGEHFIQWLDNISDFNLWIHVGIPALTQSKCPMLITDFLSRVDPTKIFESFYSSDFNPAEALEFISKYFGRLMVLTSPTEYAARGSGLSEYENIEEKPINGITADRFALMVVEKNILNELSHYLEDSSFVVRRAALRCLSSLLLTSRKELVDSTAVRSFVFLLADSLSSGDKSVLMGALRSLVLMCRKCSGEKLKELYEISEDCGLGDLIDELCDDEDEDIEEGADMVRIQLGLLSATFGQI